ncbi:radical SAM protein, partial [Clostridium perfringens]
NNARFNDVEEVKKYINSICLMVGIKGQTKYIIKRDMDILLNNFKYLTVNILTENTTSFKREDDSIK